MSTSLRLARMLGIVALVSWGGPVLALTVTHTIDDIMMNFTADCGTTPPAPVNMGDLSISVNNGTTAPRGLNAVFTVDPAISGMGSGGSMIWECVDLHWVQLITADACPATVTGQAAGGVALPFPVIDTPPNGWDYIYKDLDMPADGIQADERVPGNVDGAGLTDDANDTLPWYHTLDEEAMLAGSGNATGGLGTFTECVTYGIKDVPGFCPDGGITAFTTFLVAVPKHNCDDGTCLSTDEMLILAGFDWNWSSNNDRLSVGNTMLGAFDIENALTNTGFSGWSAYDDGAICCPEPGSIVLMTLAMVGTVLTIRRRS